MKRFLLLSDGSVYKGLPLGAEGDTFGEVVFNTGMTGYQEILTDPSYAGQIVLLTYPLIGNYGINDDDFESNRIQPSGLIVREACDAPSNWRSTKSVDTLLKERGKVGIQGLDTRAITKHIRSGGVETGVISDDLERGKALIAAAKRYDDSDFVYDVTTNEPYEWGSEGIEAFGTGFGSSRLTLAVLDCGLKYNILRRFYRAGCRPIVFPANASVDQILDVRPHGILLSPGPGDPARLGPVVQTVQQLLGKVPMFGICLGHQLLCQAIGGSTFKLKFGHRGANHPVKDLRTGKVTITSQNHGYAVAPESIEGKGAMVTQINLNDGTLEGASVPEADASSIQYHPEAAPGPWDSRPYFSDFTALMAARK